MALSKTVSSSECCYTKCPVFYCYAELHYGQCHYVERRYAECHCTGCRGAISAFIFRTSTRDKRFSLKDVSSSATELNRRENENHELRRRWRCRRLPRRVGVVVGKSGHRQGTDVKKIFRFNDAEMSELVKFLSSSTAYYF
jgi:hypothetical protein